MIILGVTPPDQDIRRDCDPLHHRRGPHQRGSLHPRQHGPNRRRSGRLLVLTRGASSAPPTAHHARPRLRPGPRRSVAGRRRPSPAAPVPTHRAPAEHDPQPRIPPVTPASGPSTSQLPGRRQLDAPRHHPGSSPAPQRRARSSRTVRLRAGHPSGRCAHHHARVPSRGTRHARPRRRRCGPGARSTTSGPGQGEAGRPACGYRPALPPAAGSRLESGAGPCRHRVPRAAAQDRGRPPRPGHPDRGAPPPRRARARGTRRRAGTAPSPPPRRGRRP